MSTVVEERLAEIEQLYRKNHVSRFELSLSGYTSRQNYYNPSLFVC